MKKFSLKTNDHYQIQITTFLPKNTNNKTVLINSATGVRQNYYYKFASFLQSKGYTVYTYDYRGIAESRPEKLKGFKATATQWGENDAESMIYYVKNQNPEHKVILMGHSIGGQLIGMMPSNHIADRIITVASQTGYCNFWKGFNLLYMLTIWYLVFPITIPVWGYFPGKLFGVMEDLPKGMANEWSKWCRSKNYFFDFKPDLQENFNQVTKKIVALSCSDDLYAPKEAVDWLFERYENASVERIHLKPEDLNVKKIGHFGFFKSEFENTVWKMLEEKMQF
ncbi:hypothetical protein UJ101_00511 [Flavobacteriaceae bacterium UJ101]|nr:hypothetical protein UJ101_00511 [Flavobacteriaceae bacterium UJ101]